MFIRDFTDGDENGRADFVDACDSKLFTRGDANADEQTDLSDAVFVLSWLFLGGADPACLTSANANGDAAVDIADPIYLLNFLFLGGPAPVAPYPKCGPGTLPADEELGCETPPKHCPQ